MPNSIVQYSSVFNHMAMILFLVVLILPSYLGVGSWWATARTAPIDTRDESPTDVCVRFSQQSALVNDTVYLYGGHSTTSSQQTENTWNNDFVTLSLSSSFDIASPPLKGLTQPSGPPAVANGYLWHSDDTLFLYGGIYSDKPPVTPDPFALWEYSISRKVWSQSKTSGDTVGRSGEGAGVTVPDQNLGFYFGGHQDGYTTQGWPQSIKRVYLTSLLRFDMHNREFKNITGGDIQGAGFPERADGVLLYVPWGEKGILVNLAGGDDQTFAQLNIVDVFDIATEKWYKQSTAGPTPEIRVNPCAVVASALDGSSHNIYMFGGQNLLPYGSQVQKDDLWILTIPSFTWIQVDQSSEMKPPARAGHACELYEGKMIVVGGYIKSTNISCDSPGVYVLDTSTLKWETEFTKQTDADKYYEVPSLIVSVVGGNKAGSATVTAPVRTPDPDSPLVTGKNNYTPTFTPVVSTATVSGSARLVTSLPTTSSSSGSGSGSSQASSGPNIAAIVGGTVGGIAALVALLFLGALLLYKHRIGKLRATIAEMQNREDEKRGRGHSRGPSTGSDVPLDPNGDIQFGLDGEPSFWGVLLSPRRSLRVVNR